MTARFSPSLAFWSLGALGAGLALGTLGQVTGVPFFWTLSGAVAPLGAIWLNALQMTVIPLVITQLLAATVRPDEGSSVGGLEGRALSLMVGLLVLFGLMTLMVTPLILGVYSVPPDLVASLRVESIPQAALDAARAEPVGLGEWLANLIPRNPFEAAARGDILQMLVFTVLVGVALGRLPAEQRNPMAATLRTLADGMMVLVSWVVWGTPLGVFSLILGLSLQTGLGALGLYSVYLGVLCTLLVLATILLYPITALLGRTSMGTFARAVAPAQLVAAGTQSSLASLPALIQGARASLRLSDRVRASFCLFASPPSS